MHIFWLLYGMITVHTSSHYLFFYIIIGDHGNIALISVIHKQLAVLSQWLQYSQDLTQELRRSELLTKLLRILDKLPTTTSLSIAHQATGDEVITCNHVIIEQLGLCHIIIEFKINYSA